jgi:hypothetical protein
MRATIARTSTWVGFSASKYSGENNIYRGRLHRMMKSGGWVNYLNGVDALWELGERAGTAS